MRLREKSSLVKIDYQPSEYPCFVNGDPLHLTNVFYNLLDNAIKYSGSEPFIKVICKCTTRQVLITFQDNGPGIANIYRTRIFERFFRIPENPDIHNVKGTGLGLHYVKEIINRHGGKIEVVGGQGQGALFTIYLPAYDEI